MESEPCLVELEPCLLELVLSSLEWVFFLHPAWFFLKSSQNFFAPSFGSPRLSMSISQWLLSLLRDIFFFLLHLLWFVSAMYCAQFIDFFLGFCPCRHVGPAWNGVKAPFCNHLSFFTIWTSSMTVSKQPLCSHLNLLNVHFPSNANERLLLQVEFFLSAQQAHLGAIHSR